MRAAFKVLAMIDPGRGGRRIAILGDMLELGKEAAKAHKDLALPLQAAGVQLVYTCGTLMKNLYDSIPKEQQGAHATTSQELAQLFDVLVPGNGDGKGIRRVKWDRLSRRCAHCLRYRLKTRQYQ